MKSWVKIVIAIVLGVTTGLTFGSHATILEPIGTLFINLLRMLIVPLVASSMLIGIANTEPSKLGRVGSRALLLYGLSTVVALVLGLSLANFLDIGKSMHLALPATSKTQALPSISALILSICPKNPVSALAEGNVLQIIFFCILFGVAMQSLGESKKGLLSVFEAIAKAMFKMTEFVMAVAPFGVFALMASTTGALGLESLLPVVGFLLTYYLGAIIYTLVVYFSIMIFLAKISPKKFFKGMFEPLITGASTCSSSATLPVTIAAVTKNFGMKPGFANFILPFGCPLNLNGSALFQAMAAIFIANAYGIDLTMQHYVVMIITVILATFGTASIPSGGLIMLSLVFTSVGIPLEGVAILASVDRLRDMVSTMLNITGDTVTALYLAKLEGEIEEPLPVTA